MILGTIMADNISGFLLQTTLQLPFLNWTIHLSPLTDPKSGISGQGLDGAGSK